MSEEPKTSRKKPWQPPRPILIGLAALALVGLITTILLVSVRDDEETNQSLITIVGIATTVICGVLICLYLVIPFFRWLFTWRIMKRCLVVFACLTVLATFFYAEEDLRGKWAWEKFKRTYEAKSEPLDLASFIPPPVPDDQNFALAPIIASGYAEWLDGHGHRIKPPKKDVINRLEMKIGGRKNIWEGNTNTLGTLGNWQKAVKINLKGWQEYYRTPTDTNYYTAGTNECPVAPSPPVFCAITCAT